VALQSARAEEVERRGSIKALNAELGQLKQETSTLEPREAALASATSRLAAIEEQITLRQREAAAAIVQVNQLAEQISRRREEAALLDKTITDLEKSRAAIRIEIINLEQDRQQLNNGRTQSPPEWFSNPLNYWKLEK